MDSTIGAVTSNMLPQEESMILCSMRAVSIFMFRFFAGLVILSVSTSADFHVDAAYHKTSAKSGAAVTLSS
jgi:hypothetical protein